jgi:hypothetical protein
MRTERRVGLHVKCPLFKWLYNSCLAVLGVLRAYHVDMNVPKRGERGS